MLSKRKGQVKKDVPADTLVGRRTEIKGDLSFSGGLYVEGVIRGNVQATGEGDSTLTLAEAGRIEGDVIVPHAVINGEVNGSVRSSDYISLLEKARVTGDVYYNLIEMAMGSEVNGNLLHQGAGQAALPSHQVGEQTILE